MVNDDNSYSNWHDGLEHYISGICQYEPVNPSAYNLHLEECIKQLHLGNPEDALDHCQLADHELGVLLNTTADEYGSVTNCI